MALIDDIIKWFKKPKTWQGIAGLVVIVIVLALDFAYWAGAIKVEEFPTETADGGGEEEGIENWTFELEQEEFSGTLLLPSPLGYVPPQEGLQYINHEFEVKENATIAYINATVDDSSLNARPDLELVVYDPNGTVVEEQRTEAADEKAVLKENDLNTTGTWTAKVENYSSFDIDYTLTIDIIYKRPFAKADEGEGG